MKKKSRIWLGAFVTLVIAGAVFGVAFSGTQALGSKKDSLPTVRVKRGDVEFKVYTSGELRPAKSAMLVAPQMGGMLQIVTLRQTGERVNEGDIVAEFDPSEQEYNLEQARIDVMLAEQEITKARADAAVQASQDQVALLRAKFDVRRAELEVSRNELVSQIDAQKNNLALAESKRRLTQLELDVKSRAASSQAGVAVLEERRNRSRLNMMVSQQNINNMTVTAPVSGLVSVKEAQQDFMIWGMPIPELRPGDSVWPGRTIAQVLQVEDMEILAKVSENDRGNINPGQPVEVRLDANPAQVLSGKVKTVAGMAARDRFFGGSAAEKSFDATFALDRANVSVRPGSTAQVIILGERVRNALYLPRQAIFDKDGKPVVYVLNGDSFEPKDVKVLKRTESQVAIEGLKEGEEVALVNPEAKRSTAPNGKSPAKTAPPAPGSKSGM
jgi:multidrug resistance efflux pump